MDSLENTMNQTALNDSKIHKEQQITKKIQKVQISEERVEHEINKIQETSDGDENDEYSGKDEADDKQPHNTKATSDTQTRNDLEEVQEFYRKNLQLNGNLNTLTTQQNVEDIITAFLTNNDSVSNVNDLDSHVGLQAIHIRKELEEQTLNEILKELNRAERPPTRRRQRLEETTTSNKNLKKLNNKKFKHVKSTGYGSANWSPIRLQSPPNKGIKSSLNDTLASSKSYVSIEVDNALIKSQKNDTQEFMKKIASLMEERERDKAALKELKGFILT